jgi:hypothetical protein
MVDLNARYSRFLLVLIAFSAVVTSPALGAQQAPRPLTNDDVVRLVKDGVPESVIVSSIQSRTSNFDVSPEALISLHKAGVSEKVLDAMVVAGGKPSGPTPEPAPAATTPPPTFQPPVVEVKNQLGGMPMEMPLEKTQLAETKTKPSSLASLAGDSAVTQAIQAGVGDATWRAASHINSGLGGSAVEQAGGIFTSALSHRKPTVTYVWGVPGPASSNVLPGDGSYTPAFLVNFSQTPGVNPQDFEPAIVKLTPAQNVCRIVGATEGKEDARSSDAADWKIYSSFLEDRVAVNSQREGPGQYRLTPKTALFPGEYAVVLRPVLKAKKFSGGDVARNQGDGFMFNAVWSFEIAMPSKPQ